MAGGRIINELQRASSEIRKLQGVSKGGLLIVYNEISMLRREFNNIYPAFKPDEILQLNFNWVCEELIYHKEKALIAYDAELATYNNKRNG
jgi:hypothetical protein